MRHGAPGGLSSSALGPGSAARRVCVVESLDMKDFDGWNERKKAISASTFDDYVHAREVWWCAIGVNIGVEADGKHDHFERPVLILRKFSKDAVLVVCLTSSAKPDNPYHVVYSHDGREFAAIISQVRLVSTKRLIRKLFSMSEDNFMRIAGAVTEMIENKRPPLARGPRRPSGR